MLVKLIVGLGNPGRKYEGTRHNMGYAVLAELAKKFGTTGTKSKFEGEVVEAVLGSQRALLLGPMTYMNLSGRSVRAAVGFYKLALEDLLVICDDLNLPLGKVRFRAQGSAGGQKGLADIIRQLGSDSFARLRIGIDRPPDDRNWADYVLRKFSKAEMPAVEEAVWRAVDGAADWACQGIETCMNRYN